MFALRRLRRLSPEHKSWGYLGTDHRVYQKQAQKIADEIKEAAGDNTCGTCAEFDGGGHCTLHEARICGPLATQASATACDQWRERT